MTTGNLPSGSAAISAELDALVFGEGGLLPAIIQDDATGDVLMLAWMDREAVRRTLTTGRVTFWSRSRQEYWRKGDTSGHCQYVRSVAADCDADTLLVRVEQIGAACHTGTRTCFDGRAISAVTGDPAADD
jgi:phosphoribosyl-AMP cyclohydrolase